MKVTDLFVKNATSDKTYTVITNGLELNYIYGPREGKKTTLFQIADDKAEAAKLHADTVTGLMKKGYQFVDAKQAPKTPTDIAEFRRAAALKAWDTMRANGTKPAAKVVTAKAPRVPGAEPTPEQLAARSDAAKRAWVTIRANREAAALEAKKAERAAKKAAKAVAVPVAKVKVAKAA